VRHISPPQAPRNRGFTILLALLWVALLLYIFTHPDPVGFIVLGVFTVFVLPLFILTFRLQQAPDDEAHATDDENDPPHSTSGHVQR
jgi:hypothetical protein